MPKIRQVTDAAEARRLIPLIDRCAEEAMAEFRDEPLPEGVAHRFLVRAFDDPRTVVLVTEPDGGGEPLGLCVTGPFTDPLTGEVSPMILVLYVHSDVRHRGLARRMVREVLAILVGRGERVLAARAGHNDDALISMGERWGFLRQWELMLHE